ncbi:PmoA family protein [Balneolales bacterium ANBcel1]|nr:PmoA family protein [Balneolales bacterium ANBcel1]
MKTPARFSTMLPGQFAAFSGMTNTRFPGVPSTGMNQPDRTAIGHGNAARLFPLLLLCFLLACTGQEAEPPAPPSPPVSASPDGVIDEERASYTITVSAGSFDREETIVSLQFPGAVVPGYYQLTDDAGHSTALQVDDRNSGWFILDELPAGESKTYFFDGSQPMESVDEAADETVLPVVDPGTVTFTVNGNPVLNYFHGDNDPPAELDERYRRGGYIHPVYSPEGVELTSHLDPDGHPHHAGIWSAWTNTRFNGNTPDFWNIHQNTGRVDIDTMHTLWSGAVHGGFRARHHFYDLSGDEPAVALNEQWEVRVYRSPEATDVLFFDLEVTQTANTGHPLILPEYRYGGIGFRGHPDWGDPGNCSFLTSGGLGRDGHATRARWAHIGGYTGGQLAGIAVLGHPSNYRFPQTMRIHPVDPFFNFAPTQLGDMRIDPGNPYVARYRFVTYDGDPDPGLIDRLWNDYAYPPGVTVHER